MSSTGSVEVKERTADPQVDEVVKALQVFHEPGDIIEIRALNIPSPRGRPFTSAGYFKSPEAAARAALQCEAREAEGIYFVLNKIDPQAYARSPEQLSDYPKHATSDRDIVRRRWLLLDCDPERPAGVSSSEEQLKASHLAIDQLEEHLACIGWPTGVRARSGNGHHLLKRIELPNDSESQKLVSSCLHSLAKVAEGFDLPCKVKLDTAVHNAARITKLYGTRSRKGHEVGGLRHRRSELLFVPENMVPVTSDMLLAVAEGSTSHQSDHDDDGRSDGFRSRLLVGNWLRDRGYEFRESTTRQGWPSWLITCPFDESHGQRGETYIAQAPNGALSFKCQHDSCDTHCWQDAKDRIGPPQPHHYDPPLGSDGQKQSLRTSSADCTLEIVEDPWPEPLDEAAFHGPAGEFVHLIEPHSEADPAALLIQFLVCYGSTIGRSAHFKVGADLHFGNLYVCAVGRTSRGRKGSSLSAALKPFSLADPDWPSARGDTGGLSSGEGLIWQVRDAITKREKDKKSGQYIEVTFDPGIEDKRFLSMESEFSQALRVMAREGNTLSPIIRQAWDRGSLRTMTKNSPARATEAHISIIGHITRDELRRLLTETDVANGFANRFLWFCVRRSKELPRGGNLNNEGLDPLIERLRRAIHFGSNMRLVDMDEQAWAIWDEVYGALSAGRPGLLGAVLGRAEAQTRRLALIYALLDYSSVVTAEHLRAALAVWQYAEDSARHIFGSMLGDPTADEILRALRRSPDGLTRRQLSEFFGRNKRSAEISRALTVLLDYGLAHVDRRETGGRPAEVWHANAVT